MFGLRASSGLFSLLLFLLIKKLLLLLWLLFAIDCNWLLFFVVAAGICCIGILYIRGSSFLNNEDLSISVYKSMGTHRTKWDPDSITS